MSEAHDDASVCVGVGDYVAVTSLIRVGVLAIPLDNALKVLGNLGTFNSVGFGIATSREAAVAAGPGYLLGTLVGSIFPTIAGIFGAFALFAYLPDRTRQRRTLVSALVCSIVGVGICLPPLGVVTYEIPALAHQYQAGGVLGLLAGGYLALAIRRDLAEHRDDAAAEALTACGSVRAQRPAGKSRGRRARGDELPRRLA